MESPVRIRDSRRVSAHPLSPKPAGRAAVRPSHTSTSPAPYGEAGSPRPPLSRRLSGLPLVITFQHENQRLRALRKRLHGGGAERRRTFRGASPSPRVLVFPAIRHHPPLVDPTAHVAPITRD